MTRISTSAFTLELGERRAGAVTVTLHGELDLAVAIEVRRLVEAELDAGSDLIVDLSGVEFVDSTGLATLLGVDTRAATVGRRLRIRGPLQSQVRRALRITGLDARLTLE